jgi:carboxyl-terminal processing protease
LTVIVVVLGLLGCVAPKVRGRVPAPSTETVILEAAAVISDEHITAVERDGLLRAAAQALGADARVPDNLDMSGGSARKSLEAALARHRELRPGEGEPRRLSIALHAMLGALHDESRWVDETATRQEFFRPGEPTYGVGLVITTGEPFPRILRCLPSSAAAKAGLEVGLDLRSVDGRSTAELPLGEVVSLLRGPKDSEAKLEVGKQGLPSRTLVLYREPAIDHVDCRILRNHVLYLRARALNGGTVGEIRSLATFPGLSSRHVVLDLRENSGGLLDAARDLADAFLDRGTILSMAGRDGRYTAKYEARPGTSSLESSQVVVLVDGKTGSGAEAVAAALQDNRRATIVGTPTAAAARIEVLHHAGGGLIRFPVAALYRANGTILDGRGVQPDVVVDSASPPGEALEDVACPSFASPAPVSQDPVVARALVVLETAPLGGAKGSEGR